jgi:poly-gamma-glutamate synthesis protein (capsule biosynthesis protein)
MTRIRLRLLTALLVILIVGLLVPEVRRQWLVRTIAQVDNDASTFSLALTGDSIITRRLSVYQEPAFVRLIELVRGADAAFTNVEMLFHDYEGHAMNQSGGTYMRAEPALAKELAWAGFDLASLANNHTGDFGVTGMRLTVKYVQEAGLVGAGVGESLAEAREARFLEAAKARVALVSVSSTFPDHSRAGRTRGDVPPRPGLNPLRFDTRYVVPKERLTTLEAILSDLGLSRAPSPSGGLTFLGRRFEAGERAEVRTEPLKEDVDEIASVVRNAAALADHVVVSIHAHEGRDSLFTPAEFLVTFARAMIDAGADVFVGHGPHVLRAIEIYKGRPILYSLGDFIFQNETLLRLPSENYEPFDLPPTAHIADFNARRYNNDTTGFPSQREIWEAVVAMPKWQGDRLVELALHPITLGFGQPRHVRGRPLLADETLGRKIIDDVERLSKPFGTTVVWKDGAGLVSLAH